MSIFVTNQTGSALGLLIGAAVLLGLGALAVFFARRPAFKQRAAEVTVSITAIWILLAFVPLPRLSHASFSESKTILTPQDRDIPNVNTAYVNTPVDSETLPRAIPSQFAEHSQTIPQPEPNLFVTAEESVVASTAHAKSLSWIDATQYGYFVVSGCLLAWILLARVAMAVACLRWQTAPECVQEAYEGINKRRNARVMVSNRNLRPMSFGVWRPMIVLPKGLCEESELRTLRHVLLHEQAHIDRGDAVGNSMMILSSPLLWCQPLYWYLRFVANYSRELIADDVAAGQTDKLNYVDDLIDLLRRSSTGSWSVAGAIGVLGFRHPFTRRMSDLLERDEQLPVVVESRKSVLMYATSAAALILATASFGEAIGVGQALDDSPTKQPGKQPVQQVAPPEKATVTGNEEPIATTDLPETIELENGYFKSAVDILVTATDDGRVVKLHARPGQAVEKGELLVTMANAELEQALAEASQNIKILEQSIASDVNVQDAKASAKIASAELQSARSLSRQRDRNADVVSRLPQLELAASRGQLRVELANSQHAKLSMELDRDKLILKQLQQRIERLQVRAPTHGVIESVAVSQSQSVRRGERLFRIVALDQMRVEFDVPISKIFPPNLMGQKVTAEIQSPHGSPIKLVGKVTFVSSEVDLDERSMAWAVCDNVRRNGHWAVRSGMLARVTANAAVETANKDVDQVANSSEGVQQGLDELDQEEIEYLNELIASQESLAKLAKAHFDAGVGTSQQEASARRDLWRSKAELFVVQGSHDEVVSAFNKAIAFAESVEHDVAQEFKNGRADVYEQTRASQIKAQLKLDFLRYQRTRLQQP